MRIRHPAVQQGKKIVVIVGAGFAGLNAAKQLARNQGVVVILIDQRNYHLFQPLLYQVATAGLNSGDIAVPIRAQFARNDNVLVHLGEVISVDLQQKFIKFAEQEFELEYDYLILACGAQHNYFGHPEWEEFAPGLKTLEQASEIRRRTLSAFERAENEFNLEVQQSLLNFVVVGGGATGVELAGAIADISRTVLVGDFKRIKPEKAKIILVEAGPRLLTPFEPSLSERARRDLEELGVEVRLNARVEDIDANGVRVSGEFIPSKSVIWAAGVQAAKMNISQEVELDRAGRIKVESDLSIPGFPFAFAVGDMAAVKMASGELVPGVAPAAIQEGKYVAATILLSMRGLERRPFRYFDKGQIATIGRSRAVLQSGKLKLSGFLAWMAWLFIHVFYLVGFKNRFAVMFTWAWSYLRRKRGARLITEKDWQSSKRKIHSIPR